MINNHSTKNRILRKQTLSGSAIIITILGIAAMTTITIGVAKLIPDDVRQIQAFEGTLAAEQAAWGGVEHALYLIKDARLRGEYFELSQELKIASNNLAFRPFGRSDTIARCFASETREDCPGLDRQLGQGTNQTPERITTLNTEGTDYRLLVWHRRQNVGNTNDVDDFYPTNYPNNIAKLFAEALITPTLARDEVRRLDVKGVSSIRLRWRPVNKTIYPLKSSCQNDQSYLYVTQLTADGSTIPSSPAQLRLFPPNITEEQIDMPIDPLATELSLRYLVTSSADPNSNSDENLIQDCFIRYTLENTTSVDDSNRAIETSDLGFDVIESTGVSGNIQRKIRVFVNRENGNPLSILDFGVACENCEF